MFTATDDDSVFSLRSRQARTDAGQSVILVLMGALLGAVVAGLGIVAWERSTPVAAAVASADPPPVAAPTEVVDSGQVAFDELAMRLVILAGLGVVVAVLPVVIPAILSRRGYLSISRWLAMGGFASAVFIIGSAIGATASQIESAEMAGLFRLMCYLPALAGLFGVAGCLLAAAIYPKTPPTPRPTP